MRNRFAAALTLLIVLTAAGCASSRSDSGLGAATAKIAEPEVTIRQISTVPSAARYVEGDLPVHYAVRIANRAGEPITLKRIVAVSLGEGAYSLPRPAASPFNKKIEPEHYETVEFWAPAHIERRSSRRVRGPVRRRSIHASRASGGTAYAQRKTAAVAGDTPASRTRIAEKAIVSAPATATRPGWRERRPTTRWSQA